MSTDVAVHSSADLLERVVVGGDLSKLASGERMAYYKKVCESIGLNPLTRPLGYLTLSGKLVLYALKECTDQLRTIHGVSIVPPLETKVVQGIYIVTAVAKNEKGRTDISTGAVSIEGLKGEALSNAVMKCETKAKRRVTLSICGLGMLDESEVDSIPGAMVGEPEAPPQTIKAPLKDRDDLDRSKLVDEINRDSETLGLNKGQIKTNWAHYIGVNVPPERAPIVALMALAEHLYKQVAEKQPQEQVPF